MHYSCQAMKTATIPALRVDPALRRAIRRLLLRGETMSSFVEQSIRDSVERRRVNQEFIARGLVSRDEAKRTGEYFSADEVHDSLEAMTKLAEKRRAKVAR